MEFTINKRVFMRGRRNHKTTVSLTDDMYDALAKLAGETGYTVPELICEVLDQYLVFEANNGTIAMPGQKKKKRA